MRVDAAGFAIPENQPLHTERTENGLYRFPLYRSQYEYFPGRTIVLGPSPLGASPSVHDAGAVTQPGSRALFGR